MMDDEERVALVFEDAPLHQSSRFLERPQRVTAIEQALQEAGLLEACSLLENEEIVLTNEDLQHVHLPAYLTRLVAWDGCTCQQRLDDEAQQFTSLYLTPDSVEAARRAASQLCALVKHSLEADSHGFAVIRPPGHHAESSMAGGYCILNNVAIAAQYARHTLGLSRVMIFDWDVHHGNGTQAVFDQDPTVLYVSIHRSDSSFYPFGTGSPSFVGTGAGVGKTINIGWTRAGAGDAEYLAAMDSIVLPIAVEFQPDLLLISAGFDAADGDVGECHVTPEGFRALTKKLLQALPCVPVVATLEGGYVRSVLSECVVQVVQALLEGKDANLYMGGSNVDGAAMKSIDATQAALKPYWSCLQI